MARTALPITTAMGSYPADPTANTVGAATFTAVDTASSPNGNSVASTGRELLIVRNTGASGHTVTITANASPGVTITTYAIAATTVSRFGPFPVNGWRFSDGKLHVNGNHAELTVCVLRLPAVT